jgi:hypothetical protein
MISICPRTLQRRFLKIPAGFRVLSYYSKLYKYIVPMIMFTVMTKFPSVNKKITKNLKIQNWVNNKTAKYIGKGCFANKEGSGRTDYVYKMGRREKFEKELEILPAIVTKNSLEQHRDFLREVEVIISTRNIVPFTEEQLALWFPKLRLVLYGAGSVQGFARPFLNRGVRVVSGRGVSVVEDDLVRALEEKPGRTAILDVSWPELSGKTINSSPCPMYTLRPILPVTPIRRLYAWRIIWLMNSSVSSQERPYCTKYLSPCWRLWRESRDSSVRLFPDRTVKFQFDNQGLIGDFCGGKVSDP